MKRNNNLESLDILAFGAHPDDVEIGMAGTLAKYSAMGKRVGICNLTRAELSSNGTVETRQDEAEEAARHMGLDVRVQLELPDRGLFPIQPEDMAKVTAVIRKYKPTIVFAPGSPDRHPDHIHAGNIVEEAVFNARIYKYQCDEELSAHKVRDLYTYYINGVSQPDFVVDITEWQEQKRKALSSYRSQFEQLAGSVVTPLNAEYIKSVEARDKVFGSQAGVKAAEGFQTKKPFVVTNLLEGTL
ncbi:bacillithiol biosynthesis deacetylase BshB1 [Alkalicoccobacillus plakortidis]|uniref:Bacillithiol biosynthesis deacetylase BshB1 n=1 Tax=Alkalicoccobacillus plakortidis TaxID=444060 RepID=A0ABT0XEN5_9BACI|nr:bacillithiol biosynthesis deacetylase BshB1 [Alkalicoccobacillus plakortidis]MCM2674356.1 bacillithiol biosynthesis deacetylase BshB1 [Alkalicoccobacillus plakortidis]